MPNSKPKITGEMFYKFFQCPHWIWYDIYGDQSKRSEVPEIMKMIREGGLKHEKEIIKSRKFEEIQPEMYKDLDEAFLATMELMKQGKNIYHGALMYEDWVGIPDLLEARPGKSYFGDHYYVVYDIKNSQEIRDDQKFQLVFYSLILERLQGVLPREAYIVNGAGEEISFLVEDYLEEFHLTLQRIEEILEGQKPPPFLKSGCKHSPWYSICLEETEGCRDISLVYRLSQNDQRRFYEAGIRTVEDLAGADLELIRYYFEDWPFDKLLRFYSQAQALVNNEIKVLRKSEFPKVKNEIYLDVESDPTDGIDYLIGVLIKKDDGKPIYKSFWAEDKKDEKRIWEEFLNFVESLEDFVIYHYSAYEKQVFSRLSNEYGISRELENKFNENTIDLHASAVSAVIMPLYFYSLKDIAKYLGFKWNDPEAGGAESVVWYNDWQSDGDPALKKKILQYNEDDVRATLFVKEWLEGQKPRTSKEELPEE